MCQHTHSYQSYIRRLVLHWLGFLLLAALENHSYKTHKEHMQNTYTTHNSAYTTRTTASAFCNPPPGSIWDQDCVLGEGETSICHSRNHQIYLHMHLLANILSLVAITFPETPTLMDLQQSVYFPQLSFSISSLSGADNLPLEMPL